MVLVGLHLPEKNKLALVTKKNPRFPTLKSTAHVTTLPSALVYQESHPVRVLLFAPKWKYTIIKNRIQYNKNTKEKVKNQIWPLDRFINDEVLPPQNSTVCLIKTALTFSPSFPGSPSNPSFPGRP